MNSEKHIEAHLERVDSLAVAYLDLVSQIHSYCERFSEAPEVASFQNAAEALPTNLTTDDLLSMQAGRKAQEILPFVHARIKNHLSSLDRFGSAITIGPKGVAWQQYQDKSQKQAISCVIESVEPTELSTELAQEIVHEDKARIVTIAVNSVENHDDAVKRLAAYRSKKLNVLQQLVRIGLWKLAPNASMYITVSEAVTESEKIEMAEKLAEEIANYPNFLLDSIDARSPAFSKSDEKNLQERIDKMIAERIQALEMKPEQGRQNRIAAWLASREAITQDDQDTASISESTAIEEVDNGQRVESEDREKIGLEKVIVHSDAFTWAPELTKTDAIVCQTGKTKVFVIEALEKKAVVIAQRSERGMARNQKGQSKFDMSIEQEAKRLSHGIMPFEDTNSVKRLRLDNGAMRPQYSNTSIWYTFDITANAPRVYFTLFDAASVLEDGNKDDLVMVVMGKTDKQRQIDLLTVFSTHSRAHLRAGGAGSV